MHTNIPHGKTRLIYYYYYYYYYYLSIFWWGGGGGAGMDGVTFEEEG